MAQFPNNIIKFCVIVLIVYGVDYFGLIIHIFEIGYDQFYYPNRSAHFSQNEAEGIAAIHYNYSFIHKASLKCNDKVDYHLTFVIKSAVGNADRREVIRRTWGFEQRFSDVNIRRVFSLGLSTDKEQMKLVDVEAERYGDIVQANFIDSYFNNTLKTVMGMQWVSQHCKSSSNYFMFVDDDYYVSAKNVLRFLISPSHYPKPITELQREQALKLHPSQKLFAGYVLQTAPHRHKFSKWYIPLMEYPFDKWPPYITAGAFILSKGTLEELYSASRSTRHFRFDDIYLAIVALKAQVKLTHCDMFYFNKPKYKTAESFRHVIGSHGFEDSQNLESVWNECRSAGFA